LRQLEDIAAKAAHNFEIAPIIRKDMERNKILLVDDSRFFLRATASVFEREGFQVLTASTGEEALRIAQAESPALIVLDLMLPKLDGMMVLRMIRGIPDLRETPIIVLSGNSSQQDQSKALELGIIGYFLKDTTAVTDLVELVRRSLPARAS
jgi:CheY-like chemotaxis protein